MLQKSVTKVLEDGTIIKKLTLKEEEHIHSLQGEYNKAAAFCLYGVVDSEGKRVYKSVDDIKEFVSEDVLLLGAEIAEFNREHIEKKLSQTKN